jgi:hypothetical protein
MDGGLVGGKGSPVYEHAVDPAFELGGKPAPPERKCQHEMRTPLKVLQRLFEHRFQRLGVGITRHAAIGVKAQVSQLCQSHVVPGRERRSRVAFHCLAGNGTWARMAVQNENALRISHVGSG